MTKRNTSISALWFFAIFCLFHSRLAHADIFNPSFVEFRKWNCSLEYEDLCNFDNKQDRSGKTPVKILKVRAETDTGTPYLRDIKKGIVYVFSDDLSKNSPSIIREVLQGCQFRAKGNYCSMRAIVKSDIIENIEDWSLQRYQFAE